MSVSTTGNRITYTGDGVTLAFAFPYLFLANADLKVYVAGVLKTLTTDYSVTGAASASGGNVTFVVAPAAAAAVVILRDPDTLQSTVLSPNDPFPAKSVETMSDKVTLGIQRIRDLLSRAVTFADSDTTSASATLPSPLANALLGWNSAGTALQNWVAANVGLTTVSAYIATLLPAANAAAARATLGAASNGLATAAGLTQNTGKLLGRSTAAVGPLEEISVGTGLSLSAGSLSATGGAQIQPINASAGSNALTISASALSLDFRSTTLGIGTVTTVSGTPANLVVPSGATLGTTNGVLSRLAVLELNNAGTMEMAVVNAAGGVDLSETGLISTTAISAAASSASVIYSTTARTGVAYRVVGYVESTQATAGTWATNPSTVQGIGGQTRLAPPVISNSLGADVIITTAGTYYDGPSVAQGTAGTWLVTGTVSTVDTSSGVWSYKLWDGTTLIASANDSENVGTIKNVVSLSGVITNPAGNLRISATSTNSGSARFLANGSGLAKDSTITAVRIG